MESEQVSQQSDWQGALHELTGHSTRAGFTNYWNTGARETQLPALDAVWVITEHETTDASFTVAVAINDLRSIMTNSPHADAIYIIEQPDRALRQADITARFFCPVYFDPADPGIARADDAAVLATAEHIITQPLIDLATTIIAHHPTPLDTGRFSANTGT